MANWPQAPYVAPQYNQAPYSANQTYQIPQQSFYPSSQQNFMNVQNQPSQAVQGLPQQGSVSIQGRMVTSKEEALGIPVTFDGTPMFFPDLGHGIIFYKRFNANTGAADFAEFRLYVPQQTDQQENPPKEFVPVDDFTKLQSTVDSLKTEIEDLKKALAEATTTVSSKGGKK